MASIPATMTAIAIKSPGGPEMLVPTERPVPQPGEGEVLVKVAAAGVNRPDVMQRRGLYPPPPGVTDIPGLEIAGVVAACGAGVTRWRPGDEIAALVSGGGYATYCVAHESHALPMPAGLTAVQAAAVPETFFTVWHNAFERGSLKAGETLLVHGGSSGIGTAAIQLARAFGARVITTAGSAEKCDACRRLGADVAVNYKSEDFVAATKAATGGGAEVILDMVGGDYIERNYEAAAVEGRIVQIAFQGSPRASVDFRRILLKRLHHTGSTLRARSVPDKAAIARAVERNVWPLIAAGKVRPVIDSNFPLIEAAKAHARMESGVHIGKIVLVV
jgi:NADPH2:quinone reductase